MYRSYIKKQIDSNKKDKNFIYVFRKNLFKHAILHTTSLFRDIIAISRTIFDINPFAPYGYVLAAHLFSGNFSNLCFK